MFFSFTDRANKLLSDYISDVSLEIDRMGFKLDSSFRTMFLEELENIVRLYCIWRASRKKKLIVEVEDVKWVSKLAPGKILKFHLRDAEECLRVQQIELNHLQILIKKLQSVERALVLDAGCGYGRYLLRLLKCASDNHSMVGVDINKVSLIYGKTVCRRCLFLRADIREALPFQDGMFDVIVCVLVLHQTRRKRGLQMTIQEFSRLLKKDGLLYIVDFGSKNRLQTVLMQYLQTIVPEIGRYYHESHVAETLKIEDFALICREKVTTHTTRDIYAFVSQKTK